MIDLISVHNNMFSHVIDFQKIISNIMVNCHQIYDGKTTGYYASFCIDNQRYSAVMTKLSEEYSFTVLKYEDNNICKAVFQEFNATQSLSSFCVSLQRFIVQLLTQEES